MGLAATRVVALLKVLGASAAATSAPTAAEAQAHQRRDQNEDQADEHHQRHESVVSDQRTPLVLQVRNSHSPVALIRHDTCRQRDNSISEHCHTEDMSKIYILYTVLKSENLKTKQCFFYLPKQKTVEKFQCLN